MDDGDEKALSDIEEHGCHILHIAEDEEGPGFSYSIGIQQKSGQPELLITGLKRELAGNIINEYNSRIQAGESFQPNEMYSGFLGEFDVQFRPVLKEHYKEYFGWGLWLYKNDDFIVYQLIWPSTSGIWPWDNDAPSEYTYYIPTLCEPF